MVNRQHGLGRGLGALLSSPGPSSAEAPGTTTIELPIDSISPNPQQPRKDFDDRALHDLAASLKQSGVLQPVVVRRVGEGYQLVVGERRWRAAKLAGITRIPAVIREASDAQSLELALVENLLREDLNPMEEAEAYQRLLAEFAWTQEELAQRGARAALARLPCRAAAAPGGDPDAFVVGARDGARRAGQAHAADAPAAPPLGGAGRGRGRAARGARDAGAHRRQRARRAHRGQLLLSRRAGSADRADLDDVALESSA